MQTADILRANLVSPMVLCFFLGIVARLSRSDLKLPNGAYTALAIYLLLAIGMKGGVALSESSPSQLVFPLIGTVLLGAAIPLVIFLVCRRIGKLSQDDSAAMAAHYGSVSAVTFIAALTFLTLMKEPVEGFAPALVAIMELPGIIVGLLLAKRATNAANGESGGLKEAMHEILTGKSIVLLAGGLVIGALAGKDGYATVDPFFVQPFKGALCIFLLDMGLMAADRISEVRKCGWFIVGLGIGGPLVLGTLGILVGKLVGLSLGGATLLGALSASASYIAAPAAVRVALPNANPSLYLGAAIGVTFPFNLTAGIPLYYAMAQAIFR